MKMQGKKTWSLQLFSKKNVNPFKAIALNMRACYWALTVFVCRLEFDAYRSDLEELSLGPRDAAAMVRIEMAQHEYQIHRDKYERLRSDVTIKLKFLEENKVCSFF